MKNDDNDLLSFSLSEAGGGTHSLSETGTLTSLPLAHCKVNYYYNAGELLDYTVVTVLLPCRGNLLSQ
eukprot:scaffold7806_cov250-Ochromonas_danica.AAC.10